MGLAEGAAERRAAHYRCFPPTLGVQGLAIAPAPVDERVDAVVYQAPFEERCFRARYPNASGQTKEQVVHPLALVVHMPQRYLMSTVRAAQAPIQLALAWIRSAELLAQPREASGPVLLLRPVND